MPQSHALCVEHGGSGGPLLVLLHGLGANAAVWQRITPLLETNWPGRWLAPDFRGHGRSPFAGLFGYAAHAADIAALIDDEAELVTLVGHSFGGVVAALVGTGWFGPQVRQVVAFGVKLDWTAEEVAKAHALSVRAPQRFPMRAEAVERALKVAGLHGLVDPGAAESLRGTRAAGDGFGLAMDPRVYGAVGPSIDAILRACAVPLRLAAGDRDPMVTAQAMRRIDADAAVIPDAGHNPHWEAPEALWRVIENSIAER